MAELSDLACSNCTEARCGMMSMQQVFIDEGLMGICSNCGANQLGWMPAFGLADASMYPVQTIFKKLASTPNNVPKMTVESGSYLFHYLIEGSACFLTLTEKGYPKKLAFQYLEELAGEFNRLYGQQVDTVTRPYAFIKFGKCWNTP